MWTPTLEWTLDCKWRNLNPILNNWCHPERSLASGVAHIHYKDVVTSQLPCDHTEYCQYPHPLPPLPSVKMHIERWRAGQGREGPAVRWWAGYCGLGAGRCSGASLHMHSSTPALQLTSWARGQASTGEQEGGERGVICSSRGARLLGKGADNRQRVLWGVIWTLQGVGQPHQPDTPLLLSWYQINL